MGKALITVTCAAIVVAGSHAAPAVSSADPTHDRRVAAFVGGMVADAAAGPLFWIYDTTQIQQLLSQAGLEATPEFFPTNHGPFTPQYPVGANTCFGEQTLIYARALAQAGKVVPQGIADAYEAYYSSPANTSRPYKSYVDQATRKFLANVWAGAKWPNTGDDDAETNAVAHVLPVVVMRAGQPGFLADAEAAIRVVQDNDDAVAFGMLYARIMERVIMGSTVLDAIAAVATTLHQGTGNPNDAWLAHGLDKMKEWAPRPCLDIVMEIGQSCDFPNHAFTVPQLMYHYNGTASYVDAVRENIKLGGENADRGAFIGSLLAAEAGSVEKAIPSDWIKKSLDGSEIMDLAQKLAGAAATATQTQQPHQQQQAPHRRSTVSLSSSQREIVSPSPVSGPSNPDDLKALTALYHSAGGAGWIEAGGWLDTSSSVCDWERIVCDDNNRVSILRFLGNNMTGTLPTELGLLTSMTELHLGWNPGLGGPIPSSIGDMTSLQKLYVWNASLTSVPPELGKCPSLTQIDLTDNKLQGELPTELAQLTKVDTAYFDGSANALKCPVAPEVDAWLKKVPYSAPPCKTMA